MDQRDDAMMEQAPTGTLVVYGHDYCALAAVLRNELQRHDVAHDYRDIIAEPRFKASLQALTGGDLSVPTVILPDGTTLVEPAIDEVLARMGVRKPGRLRRLLARLKG